MKAMSSAPIRVAVLGYGMSGRIFHCPFITAVPGLELSAIVVRPSVQAERISSAASAAYPSARILRSVADACNDPAIDLVVVNTPNATHVELATQALKAGKHVVVDKPLAPTSAEARALINVSQAQGTILAPFHNRRYDGDFLTVQKLLTAGTLGRVVQVITHWDRYRPQPKPNSWKEVAAPASGNLFDLGPHLVDQALALYGLPSHVTASVRSDRDQSNIDDAADLALRYTVNGRSLNYECHLSMLAADPAARFRVYGTQGSYIKFGVDPQEAALNAGDRPPQLGSAAPWLPEAEDAWGVLTVAPDNTDPTKLQRSKYPSATGDYRLFYANVRDAIRGEAALAIPAEDGFRTIRLLELALRSSHEQRTLNVSDGADVDIA